MVLKRIIRARGFELSDKEERAVHRLLDRLERRLEHHPDPTAALSFTPHRAMRRVGLHLRVRLGPLGPSLISRQSAETLERATILAVEDIERQLERRHAEQRGEDTFGVPSRRLPASLRPAEFPSPPAEDGATSAEDEEAEEKEAVDVDVDLEGVEMEAVDKDMTA